MQGIPGSGRPDERALAEVSGRAWVAMAITAVTQGHDRRCATALGKVAALLPCQSRRSMPVPGQPMAHAPACPVFENMTVNAWAGRRALLVRAWSCVHRIDSR